jgi:uncharacterized protein YidB (DUF937 family)
MGLLDGLLGQVLGGMAQGGGRMPAHGPGGMGGLEDILGMGRSARGGGMPGMSGGAPGLGGIGMAALVAIALQLLQRNGGLEQILGRLRQQGHGQEADSWVSTGENLPIDPDALGQIFGRDAIGEVARQHGVEPNDALGGLASLFPEIVDQMTPQGHIEGGSDDVVAQALETLRQKQGRG